MIALNRVVDTIIIHHSATPPTTDIGAVEIREWHLERDYSDIGYHEVIRIDGQIEAGRDRDIEGAHCLGHNKHSIGICLVGDGRCGFTEAQYKSLGALLRHYRRMLPEVHIGVHNDFAATICPGMPRTELLAKVKL
ncbi:MAG: N-acetylmuramoyl-L-alanine amidase [Gammaproteobacteria bacterium]|nr:N-acetylmuramoyl-L-alanine amidase [Gammaproteobacteria bacterium]